MLARLPLVDREDFERASAWFDRHGRASIFFGRLIPGVRSLISLPAGADRTRAAKAARRAVGAGLTQVDRRRAERDRLVKRWGELLTEHKADLAALVTEVHGHG